MAVGALSDWLFEHPSAQPLDHLVESHFGTSDVAAHWPTLNASVSSVISTLLHHEDLMSGTSSASAAQAAAKDILPLLTVGQSDITVNAGGSVALPIKAHDANSVTIAGLTSYESVTDTLDHKTFTGSSITLTAAEVNSGLSLASDYTGTGHPVNTLSVTASETIAGHTLTSAAQTIQVTDPPTSTSSSATTNGLTLQVSGDNLHGTDPQIEVFVDGTQIGGTFTITADHSSGQTQTINVGGNFDPTVAHQVQVKFINDAWDGQSGDGNDVNAYVESISLNGQTLNGGQGTNAATNGAVQAANANEAVMDIDGTLTFSVAAAPPAPAASTSSNPLTLVVTGDNLHGTDPQIQVFVDGTQIGGTFTITADHSAGQTQTINVGGNFDPTVAHQVQVKFINDAWDGQSGDGNDINAYVESISLNGTSIAGAHGTNNATNGGVQPANANEAVMDINGTLTFSVAAAPPAPSASTSSNSLTLVVTGDNLHGTDPQIQVFVDGQQAGGTFTITADHSAGQTQTIQVPGNFDPTVAHQVQVKFINDAWDGQSGDGNDINAYVESISLNGTSIAGAHGTNNATNGGVQPANANEAVMDINGTLTFNVAADPPAASVSSSTSGSGSSGSGSTSAGSATLLNGAAAGILPAKIDMTYYWPFGSHPTIPQIEAQAPEINVLDYIAAIPSGNGNANMILNGGAETNLAADIQAWEGTGRVALLMVSNVGVNGAPINLNTSADVTNFVHSISSLVNTYHFQGIDWDLEDSFTQSTPSAVVSATAQLKAEFGSNFIIAAVPRAYEVRNDGIWAQAMQAMGSNLNLISLQEYDSTAYADPSFAQIKTDYADLVGEGFSPSEILLGTGPGTSVAGGAATPQVYANALTYLENTYGIRGAMAWQSDADFNDGWAYASALGQVLGA
jgi:hypothetical protein